MTLYVFALVLGGVLLVGSLVLGSDSDADVEGGLEGGLDHDAVLDAGADADVDHDVGSDPGHAEGPLHGDLATLFLSLRFWTFFATFFGMTGVVLQGLDLLPGVLVLPVALVVGGICGLAAALTFRLLGRDQVGAVATSGDYVGQAGRVLLTVGPGRTGKVRLTLRGTTVDVLAATFREGEELAPGDSALVVRMSDATALVTGLGDATEPPLISKES